MSSSHSAHTDLRKSIHDFVVAGAGNELTEEQWTDFERLLRESDDACRLYAGYVGISVLLPAILSSVPDEESSPSDILSPARQGPTVSLGPGVLGGIWHTALASFPEGMLLAYLLATVIVGIGLLIGSLIYVAGPEQVASEPSPATQGFATHDPQTQFIGRITGMVDCQWDRQVGWVNRSAAPPETKSLVSLGDRFALSSGLMEITYDTGAKVILQGPVTYEVESKDRGYLSVGKLTARMENKEERRTKNEELSASRSSFLIPHSYFAIRTPSATVTDLGTEFGVEVSNNGNTTSHVFRGSVSVQSVAADGANETAASVLHENMSVRIEANQDAKGGSPQVTVIRSSTPPVRFVRAIPKPTIATLDLVDVVAGGDGFSGRRSAGIDVTSGQAVDSMMSPSVENPHQILGGDHRYHCVDGLKFVDGVFIPDGGDKPVQTDSAGHAFEGFPHTANTTSNHLWAGGPLPIRLVPPWDHATGSLAELGGVDYSAEGRGSLFLHANKGITFDLDAIRQAHPDHKLLRFRAVAGNTEIAFQQGLEFRADIWVLVDGQMRFERRKISGWNVAVGITIPISKHDHFLTLAATDAGDGIGWDWILFGNPQIDMVRSISESHPE